VGRERLRGPLTRDDVLTDSWLRSHGNTGAGHESRKSAICAKMSFTESRTADARVPCTVLHSQSAASHWTIYDSSSLHSQSAASHWTVYDSSARHSQSAVRVEVVRMIRHSYVNDSGLYRRRLSGSGPSPEMSFSFLSPRRC